MTREELDPSPGEGAMEPPYQLLIEHAPDMVVLVDERAVILYQAPSGERITGRAANGTVGTFLRDLVEREDFGAVERLVSEALALPAGQPTAPCDLRHVRPDGRPEVLEAIAARIQPETGGPTVMINARVVTERRRAEEELRTAAAAAKAATRAKSDFLATMSHEIRTPLAGIIGMAELMRQSDLSDEQRQFATALGDSADALLAIVTDVLDFSKIEANEVELEEIDFDLRATVASAVGPHVHPAGTRGVVVVSLVGATVPAQVRGDVGRFRQVLTNLLTNALKFTQQGDVIVRVSLEHPVAGGVATIRVAVTDSGVGMAPESMARLFRPFSQADSTVSRKYGGTGLGLTISRRFVELMGGQIDVQSTEGVGSTFWFTVPFKTRLATRPASPESDLQRQRILVVNDVAGRRAALLEQLASFGTRAEATDSPDYVSSIVSAAREEGDPIVAIIVDDSASAGTGLVLGLRIKSEPETTAIPIVVLTAVGRPGEGASAREAGVAAYLSSPVATDDLRGALSSLLAREPGTPASLITRHTLADVRERSRARILIVEDDPVLQKVGVAILHRLGYRVEVATTGIEAVEAALATPYDLILMDSRLPELDGLAATARIRAGEPSGRRAAIIALTADATPQDRERCLAAGMDDYLSKPVRAALLEETVERWLPETLLADAQVAPHGDLPDSGEAHRGTAFAGSPPAPVLLDRETIETIREIAEGEPGDMLGELIEIFVTETERLIVAIGAAIEDQDTEALTAAAHRLNGSAGAIGAARVRALASQLETAARAADLSDVGDLLVRLADAFRGTQTAFKRLELAS